MYLKKRNVLLNKITKCEKKLLKYKQELTAIEKFINSDNQRMKEYMNNISLTERYKGIYVLVPFSFNISKYVGDEGYDTGYEPSFKLIKDDILRYEKIEAWIEISEDSDSEDIPIKYSYDMSNLNKLVDGKLYIGFDIENGLKRDKDVTGEQLAVKIYHIKWW